MAGFDWDAWMDAEFTAGQKRMGDVPTSTFVQDARYARVMDLDRRRQALIAEAKAMAAELAGPNRGPS